MISILSLIIYYTSIWTNIAVNDTGVAVDDTEVGVDDTGIAVDDRGSS